MFSFKEQESTSIKWLLGSFVLVLAMVCQPVRSHGRLIEPPSRASMWRYGFDTPPNYNDHELYCGGFTRQWQTNGGKCGICGDAWDLPKPRPHEAGGKYGNGIIVRKYKKGSMINIRVELTANHKGYFEFHLCPNNAPHKVGTQECLDLNELKLARKSNGAIYGDEPAMSHDTRYYPAAGSKVFEMKYMLPKELTCAQCILQWRYIAGNNWGMCSNGTGQVGCGPQEEFRACADVAILDTSGEADETPYIPNEIETEVPEKTPDAEEKAKEGHSEWWFLLVVIILTTLLLVLGTFAFIYFYFYKRKSVKEWWDQKKLPVFHRSPRKTHFWENLRERNRFAFWKTSELPEKKNNFTPPQPVPPPRTKRANKTTENREI